MSDALLIDFGQRVTAVREHLKVEKSTFAEKLQITQHMLTAIEAGTATPGFHFFYHVTREFGVNPLYLLMGDKPFLLRKIPIDNSGIARSNDKEHAVEQLFWYMQRSRVVKFNILEYFIRFKQEHKHDIMDDMEDGGAEDFGYIPVFRPSSEPCYIDLPYQPLREHPTTITLKRRGNKEN